MCKHSVSVSGMWGWFRWEHPVWFGRFIARKQRQIQFSFLSVKTCSKQTHMDTHTHTQMHMHNHFRFSYCTNHAENIAPNPTWAQSQAAHSLKCFKFSFQIFPFCPSFFEHSENFCNMRTAKKLLQDQLFNSQLSGKGNLWAAVISKFIQHVRWTKGSPSSQKYSYSQLTISFQSAGTFIFNNGR